MLDGASSPAVSISPLTTESAPWTLRPYDTSGEDSEALHYMLGVSYTRSRAGQRAGAHRAGGSTTVAQRQGGSTTKPEDIAKQRAFLASLSPVWTWLLENATTMLVVDRVQPRIILGWAITSEPNVVHAVGVKRTFCEGDEPASVDIVRDLLGERLGKHQVCTLELPQMATRGNGVIGIDRPRDWSLDPTWLLLRMMQR